LGEQALAPHDGDRLGEYGGVEVVVGGDEV